MPPSKLIAIPFCKIIIEALGQGAHCFVRFLLLTQSKLLSNKLSDLDRHGRVPEHMAMFFY